MLAPLALVALTTGVLLGLLRYRCVTIKLVLTTILTGIILFVLVPSLGVATNAATAAQAFTTAERLSSAVAPAAGVTLLILMVVLAIFKAPWRFRSRPNIKHELG